MGRGVNGDGSGAVEWEVREVGDRVVGGRVRQVRWGSISLSCCYPAPEDRLWGGLRGCRSHTHTHTQFINEYL